MIAKFQRLGPAPATTTAGSSSRAHPPASSSPTPPHRRAPPGLRRQPSGGGPRSLSRNGALRLLSRTEVAGQTWGQPVMILDLLSLQSYKSKITTENLVPAS